MKHRRNIKVRAGLIGIGNWGRYGHLPVLKFLTAFEVTAISSRRLEQARKLAAEYAIPYAFQDPAELIRHPEVDLVVVLPPAPHHAALVRMAITAGKDVYCEWPLTTAIADSENLLALAQAAGVRHVVGLQRRLGPSARYAQALLADGYVWRMRSVRMHVSMNSFQGRRSTDLAWTVPSENFSHILSIYGGHFLDMLFHVVGGPRTLSALVENQFTTVTLVETGEMLSNTTPDQVVVLGTLDNGAVFSVQIEGGKRSGSGLQIDITGTEGDLRISNPLSFGNPDDNSIEGARGDGDPLRSLPVPEKYKSLPSSSLDASVLDLAYVYDAYAKDRAQGTGNAPNFADAVRLHRLIELISDASNNGARMTVDFWQAEPALSASAYTVTAPGALEPSHLPSTAMSDTKTKHITSMKQQPSKNISRGLLAVIFGILFAGSAQAGPGGRESYFPVKTLEQAEEIKPGDKIAIACGNCGAVTTAIADKDRSYLRGYVCEACKRKFIVRTTPHGGPIGAFVYDDNAGHLSQLMRTH